MELELRKWLPVSSPRKILYPFPNSQSVVCWGVWVCVCCGLKKNSQHEICELSVTWGKMKTISLGDNLSHSLSMWG